MAKEKKRKRKARKGTPCETPSDRHRDVHIAPTVEFLHQHITEVLCEAVWHDGRTTERERKWSLFSLSRFWLAVILEPPPSLSQLLERVRRGDPRGFLPAVEASAEAFFQKSKTLSYHFPMDLYRRFLEVVRPKAPRRYCQELAHLQENFSDVAAIDGSRLDKVAHRQKIFWPEKAAILPGCLLGVYDLFRGITTQLWFDHDAAASEFNRALIAIDALQEGTLLLGDRLYCVPQIFARLKAGGCFGVFRRNKSVSIRKLRCLSRMKSDKGLLEDWIVRAGQGENAIELRLIRLKTGGKVYEALTSVLDPQRLSAKDVAALYPQRWKIERLFFDLKIVLNLKRFYAANPNAVAMQVYAAAIVHTAFRIAQADIAQTVRLPPEELSPQKLFPLLALASIKVIEAEFIFDETCKANRKLKLRKPSWKSLPGTVVSLRHIRAQHRSGKRKHRGYDAERGTWRSITKVNGGDALT